MRFSFGGGIQDYVADTNGRPLPNRLVRFYSAEVGGVQYTDLLIGGVAASSVTSQVAGRLPVFQGPDNIFELWADAGFGRSRMDAYDEEVYSVQVTDDAVAAAAEARAAADLATAPADAAVDAGINRAETAGRLITGATASATYLSRAAGTGLVRGLARWTASTAYTVGALIANPFGETVTAKVAHTSDTAYDATKWITPSPDGSTVIDFGQLADGPLTSVRPVQGTLDYFGLQAADYGFASVVGGKLVMPTLGPNLYMQVKCSDTVQHAWVIAEVAAVPDNNQGLLILLPGPQAWFTDTGNKAAVHSSLLGVFNAVELGRLQAGPFNTAGITTKSANVNLPYKISGRQVRFDVTLDKVSGEIRHYVDGTLVASYTDPAALAFTSRFAMFEMNGPTFKVVQFGASPVMPAVMPDQLSQDGNAQPLVTTLTTEFQLLKTVTVKYGRTGTVQITWSPYITCTAGAVFFELGTSTTADVKTFNYAMCESTTRGRTPFTMNRVGPAGTTEVVGIFGRTTGTATVFGNDKGGEGPAHRSIAPRTVF